MKFKVGDKVKVIGNCMCAECVLAKGEEWRGEIISISGSTYSVSWGNERVSNYDEEYLRPWLSAIESAKEILDDV